MAKIKVSCKYCESDIKLLGDKGKKTGVNYYCVLNKMENNECPEDCQWYIPKKMYVV